MIKKIRVGMSSCGIAAGADEVLDYIHQSQTLPPETEVEQVGCIGYCCFEPLIEILTENETLFFGKVKPGKELDAIIENPLSALPLKFPENRSKRELPRVTALCGRINPIDLEAYIAAGGYQALKKAQDMSCEKIIQEIENAGLKGRGGGGFPTFFKWNLLYKALSRETGQRSTEKVLICNADEGDPGAFMDRSMMESAPHQVLEGIMICALATGASTVYIYIRAEYPLAIKNLKKAISQVYSAKLNRFGDRVFEINMKEGAGAFVCGEETALISSLEGKRGNPRFRPPFPTESGFLGKPSMVNNVETFANVPFIIKEGAEVYKNAGTEGAAGTKLFALAGDLKYPGLVEVPFGITIADIVYKVGGAPEGSVKAVQIGGPSGGCIPASLFDTPVDYESLKKIGAIVGSGGLIVIGNEKCMVETARYFLDFTARESCGKCTFCRVGTKRMLEILIRITEGKGNFEDIGKLEDLAEKIKKGSLCGLGQTAPNPVLATLRYFRHEYENHIIQKKCEAKICNALVKIEIDRDLCLQCGRCIKNCPVSAISEDFVVDHNVCTRCNTCIEVCPKACICRV